MIRVFPLYAKIPNYICVFFHVILGFTVLPYNDIVSQRFPPFRPTEAVEKKMMSLIEQVLDKKVIDPCLGLVFFSEGKTPGAKGFRRRTANKASLNMPKPGLF